MRENSEGTPIADFGLLEVKPEDDLGVDFGDGEKDILEGGLGETDLALRVAGLGVVKFDMEAAKMQCK